MAEETYVCATCGAVIGLDWSGEHQEFHTEVSDLRTELRELRDTLRRLMVEGTTR